VAAKIRKVSESDSIVSRFFTIFLFFMGLRVQRYGILFASLYSFSVHFTSPFSPFAGLRAKKDRKRPSMQIGASDKKKTWTIT